MKVLMESDSGKPTAIQDYITQERPASVYI